MFGVKLFENAQRLVDDYAMLEERCVSSIDIGTPAKDYRDPVAGYGPVLLIASVGERVIGHLKSKEVIWLPTVNRTGHNAILERIETGEIPQVATAFTVDAVVFV